MTEISATRAAAILGKSVAAAIRALSSAGVDPVARGGGRGRQNRFDLEQVIAYADNPPLTGRPSEYFPDLGMVQLVFRDGVVDVQLGRVTAGARALVEVVAAQRGGRVGGSLVLESRRPSRGEEDLAVVGIPSGSTTTLWDSWSTWHRRGDMARDIHWWLEYEAARMAPFVAVRTQDADPAWRAASAAEALSEPALLDRNGSLAFLRRLGCKVRMSEWSAAQRHGRVPAAHVWVKGDPRWRRLDLVVSSTVLGLTARRGGVR